MYLKIYKVRGRRWRSGGSGHIFTYALGDIIIVIAFSDKKKPIALMAAADHMPAQHDVAGAASEPVSVFDVVKSLPRVCHVRV